MRGLLELVSAVDNYIIFVYTTVCKSVLVASPLAFFYEM